MRKRRRSLWGRLVYVVAGLLSIVVLLGSVAGFVVVKWFDGTIARVQLDLGSTNNAKDAPPPTPLGSQNWLLVGTDSRAGTNGEFGTGVEGERSDTTILAHLDGDGTTTNISIPRDTLVTIPSYTDKNGFHPAQQNKFNTAIFEGGPQLLVATVQKMFDVRIDHYVSVDLEGFKKISQALDGVEVCIKPAPTSANEYVNGGVITNINDGYSGFHGHYGTQKLAGDQAVAFVRQRHGLPDSDISRIQRQQQFLGSVFRTATRVNLLFKPLAVTNLLSALKSALTLDNNTSLDDLEKLGQRLRGVDPSKILFETVPNRGLATTDTDLGSIAIQDGIPVLTNNQGTFVGSVQILDQDLFDKMKAKIQDASTTTTNTGTAGSASATNVHPVGVSVDPSGVSVTVLDGLGEAGLASRVSAALAKDGFKTGVPGPAPTTGYLATQVHYNPTAAGSKEAADTVAAAVPGTVLVADSTITNGVVLIAGANVNKVVPVSTDVPVTNPDTTPPTTGTTPPQTGVGSTSTTPVSAASADNSCTY